MALCTQSDETSNRILDLRLVSLNFICNDHMSRLTPKHTNQFVFLGSINDGYCKIYWFSFFMILK